MAKRDLIYRILLLVFLLVGVVVLRIWVLEPVKITQEMSNQYIQENDVMIAVKTKDIQYGDLVLYIIDETPYVGRVIAMGGDSVTYMDDVLYRNNEIVEEQYLKRSAIHPQEYYTEDMIVTDVADDSYWILNDNRTNLADSRTFGMITANQIVGPLTFRISPLSEFGFIDVGLTQD